MGKKIKLQRTEARFIICASDADYNIIAEVEGVLNYETKKYSITHGENDGVAFGENDNIETSIDRARCVLSALKYIQKEIFPETIKRTKRTKKTNR